jgi:hypothetical protein
VFILAESPAASLYLADYIDLESKCPTQTMTQYY